MTQRFLIVLLLVLIVGSAYRYSESNSKDTSLIKVFVRGPTSCEGIAAKMEITIIASGMVMLAYFLPLYGGAGLSRMILTV